LTLIPLATSTDVERAFPRDGLTVSKMQHSLSDESTQVASVLGSWCTFQDAMPQEEIMSAFKEKGRWDKVKEVVLGDTRDTDIDIA
jgi:exo-beta-1,3-glucanase (GH17 family)